MKILVTAALLGLISCSHQGRKVENIPVAEAARREAKDLKSFELISEDQGLAFKVKAQTQPKILFNKERIPFYLVAIDIGSIAPVECFFYPSDISPAAALKVITDQLLDEKIIGKVTERKTSYINAGMYEGHPYLMLQTAFKVADKNKSLGGNVKTIVGTKEKGNVVCGHNEVGYQETFNQVFRELLTSFEFTKLPKVDLNYKSIVLVSIKDLPIGYIVEYIGGSPIYTHSWVEKTSILVPTDESNVSALDGLTVELADKEGKLAYGLYKSDENGQLAYLIEAASDDRKNYKIKGTMAGQPVQKDIKASEGIYSNFEITRMIFKKFFQQNQKSFSIPLYTPDQSLTSPTVLKLKLKKMNAAGAILQFTDGKLTHHAVVDRDGTEEAITFNLENAKIEGKRIFRAGMFPK